ncbi:hypothetical protein AK812_SmicGene42600 [Symbiodinium microadriaticum]|uniref:Uncharacterized protein n=1 Tax=Symbiodinium microadriaticum TaxID=2951 RepID=A0A1Q9C343_SYMMI|nr:hypothetical protein AK812_SmicGene42600 [Symbiodinium microadriaticum]
MGTPPPIAGWETIRALAAGHNHEVLLTAGHCWLETFLMSEQQNVPFVFSLLSAVTTAIDELREERRQAAVATTAQLKRLGEILQGNQELHARQLELVASMMGRELSAEAARGASPSVLPAAAEDSDKKGDKKRAKEQKKPKKEKKQKTTEAPEEPLFKGPPPDQGGGDGSAGLLAF